MDEVLIDLELLLRELEKVLEYDNVPPEKVKA